MRNQSLIIIALAFLLTTSVGCKKRIKYEKTKTGLEYYFFERNEDKPKGEVGDYYILGLIVRMANDSVYKNSYETGTPTRFIRSVSMYPGDIYEALAMTSVGDSLIIKVSADSFFRVHGAAFPAEMKPGEILTFTIKVQEILKEGAFKMKMFQEELTEMEKFIARKHWNIVTDTTGIKYEVTKPTQGAQIQTGDSVEISYFYYFLNEQIIAKSKPNDYWKFEVGNPDIINGISRLMTLLKDGESVRAVLPFEQAFGDVGNAGMPPFATIVMEIEIHSVTKKK
jgi:FKBP-type peptidyl-prolyl cis-trans isomerase